MNYDNIQTELKTDNIVLTPVKDSDRNFISELFKDEKIRKYYIVPKEAHQDYKRLIDYWLNDVKNGAGTCWIIKQKSSGIFSSDKQCGFISFEFRDTIKNARISYALLPNFRGSGLVSKSVGLVIERLKANGVEKVEADIDRDNLESEKVVERHGFTANKRQALVDPEMMRDGEIRMRALWKKELIELSPSSSDEKIGLNATADVLASKINTVVQEINAKGQHPLLLTKYFYLLGRLKFSEGNYEEAQEAFGQCNMITMNEGMPENYETFYWFGRINDAKGEKGNAKMYYGFALEKFNDNPNLISRDEITKAMNN
jgi:RimJ/RimL family protein N-acetyltransferase